MLSISAQAADWFEIYEFINNRDGTATLIIYCVDNKRMVQFRANRRDLDKMPIDEMYKLIEKECRDPYNVVPTKIKKERYRD